MYKIAILEDKKTDYEQLYAQLRAFGERHFPFSSITWFKSGEEILDYHDINSYDILFSDIKLNDSSNTGIDVCSNLRMQGFEGEIVFLTSFSEYVFEGYSVRAFHYLLKPITLESLENCMEKYMMLHTNDQYCLQRKETFIRIPFNHIICIHKDTNDIVIQTTNELFTERISLTEIEKKLPNQFVRCHKSSIVNLMHVESIIGNELYLSNNLKQPIGRNYLPSVRKEIMKLATK